MKEPFPDDVLEDIRFFATRPMCVQREELLKHFCIYSNTSFISVPGKNTVRDMYMNNGQNKKASLKLINSISSKSAWKKHKKEFRIKKTNMQKAAKILANNNLEDKNKAYQDFMNFFNAIQEYIIYMIMPVAIDNYFEDIFLKKLKKEFKDYREAYNKISAPTKKIEYQNMRLKIIDYFLKGKKNYKNLVDKYYYLSEYAYTEKLLDEKHFENEIKKLTTYSASEEKKDIFKIIKKNKKEYNIIISKIKDSKLKIYSEIIQFYSYFRSVRIDEYKKAQVNMRFFFENLAKKISLETKQTWDRNLIIQFLDSEIVEYLKENKIPDKKEIEKRDNQKYIYYTTNNKSYIITNSSTIKKILDEINKKLFSGTTVKGTIAQKGIARGPVKIVISYEDIKKIKEGDVLVAKVTLPQYTPAMKKAVAFVTEDGGIVSHAAVTAREMKKPCIVATGNCTKLLKDGEIVEVDANKGVVIKIK